VADDLEAVAPELVQTGEDGYRSVAYARASVLVAEAVKELAAEVPQPGPCPRLYVI
jgi:hypothetical protein